MNSSVPYLVRAIKEWVLDNGLTPYLVIDATIGEVDVPLEHVKDGRIILNISPSAVRDFRVGIEGVFFSGRFSGVPREIFSPVSAIRGIFAKENGEGMWFSEDDHTPPTKPREDDSKGPPSLKLVK